MFNMEAADKLDSKKRHSYAKVYVKKIIFAYLFSVHNVTSLRVMNKFV